MEHHDSYNHYNILNIKVKCGIMKSLETGVRRTRSPPLTTNILWFFFVIRNLHLPSLPFLNTVST